jgi:glycerol-3-phosphate dehydrogenase (NAD(P)+)
MKAMRFGIIGSGSWATALSKILTDNGVPVNWWVRSEEMLRHIETRRHNPRYLPSVNFNTSLLTLGTGIQKIFSDSDCLLIAVPSAFVPETLAVLEPGELKGKKILSAVKGILPGSNLLLNDYLKKEFGLGLEDYFTVMGPCHAEEVAAEKLSYLTFSGLDEGDTSFLASHFKTEYLNIVVNDDIYGVQYAAVLKNIYALGAGIAHGLEYGDNFLSVLIANCADEMAGFLRKAGIAHVEVGIHEFLSQKKRANYAASVYLGDLLVTCYSPYSRNRSFGHMIGRGYTVRAARQELNMVAEGYNAAKCIYLINKELKSDMPIAETLYGILWENVKVRDGLKHIEALLV